MPRCRMVFNVFGMKHLQALMLGFVYALDNVIMMALSLLAKQKRTVPPGNLPQERIWVNEYDLTHKYKWLAVGVGRGIIAFLILRVNNKYILLVFAVIEMVALLIGHALYIEKGLEALQYTYLVVLFVQGARWPLALNIISKWSTASTFTLMLWTFKGSLHFFTTMFYQLVVLLSRYGTIISMCIYMSVVVKAIFFVLWIIFGSGDPIHNVFISKEELLELRDEHRFRLKTHWKNRLPLEKMIKTPVLYGCLVLHTAYMWYRTWDGNEFVSLFPRYRKTGSWVPLFCYYMLILVAGVVAYCIDLTIKKKKSTLNNIRKTCAAISAWGGGCCFLLAGANLGKEAATTAFMALNQIFQLCNGSYDAVPIMYAVSPNYLGFTHCIISCIAYLSLGLVPVVDNLLVGDGEDATRTMSFLMFYYGSILYFGCLLMLLSGNCNRKEYDKFNTVPWKEDSIVSFP